MPDLSRITLAMQRALEVLEQGPARESNRTWGKGNRPTVQAAVAGRLRDLHLARYEMTLMGRGEMVELTDVGRQALAALRAEAAANA